MLVLGGTPYVHDALIAVGYGLMLPAIAVLHVRHAAVRRSGAMLGTIAGVTTVTVGLAGSVDADLRPAALFVLGLWWWTIGKTWAETAVMARPLGISTAALGALSLAAALSLPMGAGLGLPDPHVWEAARGVAGAWLIALAVALFASAGDVPSR